MTTEEYIDRINSRYKHGNATEHTFRGDLQQLIESIVPGIEVTNEPKRQQCGAPDYILTRKEIPIGFIEAKDIGNEDLSGRKKNGNKEQFDRYKASLNNLLFTDYLDFHLYREGKFIRSIRIAEITKNGIMSIPVNIPLFTAMITDFCLYIGQTINSSKKLAQMLAGKARMMADVIEKALLSDDETIENSSLKDQMQVFKNILIHDLTPKGFADVYAQTITYGMFAARYHDPSLPSFSRQEAYELIPKTNPFLKKLFGYIAGIDFDDRIKWVVDDLVTIFLACNVENLLQDYGKSTQTEDPIIHFYEDFLSEYDPTLRKARGVWYTPKPVVSFIVQAVDDILKTEFNLPQGLADTSKIKIKVEQQGSTKKIDKEVHKIQILDPATGTGTFLAEVIKHIHKCFQGQQGIWSNYVENHLLPRLNGFELLMASYAMAHLKLDLLLTETGYKSSRDQRFKVYLTNSLEEYHQDTGTLFANWLSTEANEANHIKRDTPVMCVIGNPPYSGESSNKGEWIMNLMQDYKKEPGGIEKLKERNPKWINDDYVKFLRYGQYLIEKNGSGVLAFINPHGFLDNPTFRGMRWSLLNVFDKIYTLDLHGNSKKKEVAPDGSIDQNVFDIMQGVSINFFIKTGKKKSNSLAKTYHYDLFGKRNFKYDFLLNNTIQSILYKEVHIKGPMFYMVHKDTTTEFDYEKGFKISDFFNVNTVGIVTSRDSFVIDDSYEDLSTRIQDFYSLDRDTLKRKYNLKEKERWNINDVKRVSKVFNSNFITNIAYRPFDNRYIYFDKTFIERSRLDVMQHFQKGDNIGLVLCRQLVSDSYSHVFVTNKIVDDSFVSNKSRERGYVYPLYLYLDNNGQKDMDQKAERIPNLNSTIIGVFSDTLKIPFKIEKDISVDSFSPIDIFDYILAILNSPFYRNKYKDFLQVDFPRIPFPKNQNTFFQLVELGKKIRLLQLLDSTTSIKMNTQYPVDGNNIITKTVFLDKKVYINDTQYFDNVSEDVWNFVIGGYCPAQKWLKDRKDCELDFEDIIHYQNILFSILEINKVMSEIDQVGFMEQ